MKLPLFSLAIILLIPFISTSQTLSDIPPFEITKPKWQYYTYDYYFPQNPRTPEDTPYGNRFIEKTVEKGDFFYILEHTATSLNGYSGWDGFRLTKLNKYSGEEVWVHQHNQHTGVKNFERPRPYIGFNTDGSIEIITLRHRDTTIRNNSNNFPFIGTPAIHTIDDETGQNITFKYGTDTTLFDHARFNDGGARLHRQEEGRYFSLLYRSEYKDGASKDFFEFNEVDENLNITKTPSTLIELNTSYSEAYRPWLNTIYTKDTMIILTGTEDKFDYFNSPKKAFLHWYNIRNIDSVYASKTMEVTDVIAKPQQNLFTYQPELIFKQEQIFLTQLMAPNNYQPARAFTWMLWTDKNGEQLGKFNYLAVQDTIYGIIIPIGVKQNKAYCLAQYYSYGEDSLDYWDVIEIEPKTNIVTKKGSFLKYNRLKYNGDFRFIIRDAHFMDNGSIAVASQIRMKKNNLEFWYSHYCSVDEKDLGIVSGTTNTEINKVGDHMIYPNPAGDKIYIRNQNNLLTNITIRDITGRLMLQQKLQNTEVQEIDITTMPPGMYYVTLTDSNFSKSPVAQKIIKL